jgi:hypothetical protein
MRDRYALAMRTGTWKGMLAAGSAIAVFAAVVAEADATPTASTPPTISGQATYGSTLTCTNGTWSAGAGSFTYRWELADGDVPIGQGATLKVRAIWASLGIVCAVTGKDTTGSATATSAPVTARAATAKITVTRAREVSTATRTILIAGRISPAASLQGRAGSLILYRLTSSGLRQLSFNGPQTHPRSNGTFSIVSTGEPTGTNTYVLQYVPSALGYTTQSVVSRRIRVVS